jgi:hypothetical protein
VAVAVEIAAKHNAMIDAPNKALAICEECHIPRDEASLKTVVDQIARMAANRGVAVQL